MCEPVFDCNDPSITPNFVLNKLTKTDADGCPAINTVEVEAAGESTCDPFITCDNADQVHWKQLVAQLIALDSNGCWALRIIKSTV